MKKTACTGMLCMFLCLGASAEAFDLRSLPEKLLKIMPIPFIDHESCREYKEQGKKVCLRGDVHLADQQIRTTEARVPRLLPCIRTGTTWVEVLFLSNRYSIRLFDSENGTKAYAGGTDVQYEIALDRLEEDVCRAQKGG